MRGPEFYDKVVASAVKDGKCQVALGYASQDEVDRVREDLQAAILRQVEPMEIITLPVGPFAGVGLLVRKFQAILGTCDRHPCSPRTACDKPHPRFYDCENWKAS